jgi:glutathione S-transferase
MTKPAVRLARHRRIHRQRDAEQQAVSRTQPRADRGQALGSPGRRYLRCRRDGLLEAKRPKKEQSADWIARQRDKVRGLEFMAEELGDKAFCMGTHFSMADIAVGTALGYLCFRFADINWQESHPNLAKLYANAATV